MSWICCSVPLYFCRWGWEGGLLLSVLRGSHWLQLYLVAYESHSKARLCTCHSSFFHLWLFRRFFCSNMWEAWSDLGCHHCHSHLQKNHMEMTTSFLSCGSPSIETAIGRAQYFELEDKILKPPFYSNNKNLILQFQVSIFKT